MNASNRHLAQYGDLTWDDVRPDECTTTDGDHAAPLPGHDMCPPCEARWVAAREADAAVLAQHDREVPVDPDVDPSGNPPADTTVGCPAGDHSWAEATGYPDRSGRCAVYAVCEDCGAEGSQTGWDSVL